MSSRFKKSLGLFKCRQAEDVYRILKEKEFEEKYVEIPPAVYLRDKDISKMQREEISALIELESFFMNLYAALRFGYEIDGILEPHKSTRIKIYFAMRNSDRYCIRLDFPHEGEDSIHLNMNQPGIKQSTGFPFGVSEYNKIKEECQGRVEASDLFYLSDGLYWFKSGYVSAMANIVDDDLKSDLEQFMHDRAHIKISSSDSESKNAVVLFSGAFAEAMIEYEAIPNIYGKTDSEDELIFKYALFLDYIYDSVIKLKYHEMGKILKVGKYYYKKESDMKNSLSKIIDVFRVYIQEKFPKDFELLNCTNNCYDISDFFEKCIDHVEKIEKENI